MAFLTYEHKDGQQHLEMEGSLVDIAFEVCYLIKQVHTTLCRNSPVDAAIFADMIRTTVQKNSPVWVVSAPAEGEVTTVTSVPKVRPHDDDV